MACYEMKLELCGYGAGQRSLPLPVVWRGDFCLSFMYRTFFKKMDPEQTFIRVQERFSQMLTPKLRVALEYMYLVIAITLFCILVVMHANYVQQPGCSSELSGVDTTEAQLILIKITSAGFWSHVDSESSKIDSAGMDVAKDKIEVANVNGDELTFLASKFWWNWIGSGARRGKLVFRFWKTDTHQAETSTSSQNSRPVIEETVIKNDKEEHRNSFTLSAKETLKAAITHFGRKWYRRISFIWRHTVQIIRNFQKLWDIAGIRLNLDIPKWMHILHLEKFNSNAVQWLTKASKSEPTYLYTTEKGYFLLPESAKFRHNVRTVNVSISAWHSCFGNRWQQLLINRFVGYDTILINSLLSSPGQGYLYNYQTKEFYNLSYAQEPPEGPARFGDYLVTKCGVLMMSLFVFFTTTMSVSFTLRETQTRMLKFTVHGVVHIGRDSLLTSSSLWLFAVQLQHHARHRLPTFQLIFVHVIESLIMIGILFFLFEFYDDQLLAFMVLILVWLCELFTLISVRTPISMKFFPRFFLLYFLVFHIYFFSYSYGFSYLALSTTAAFMQHLILYFWNRFEVPALQRFMQNRRSHQQDFHITSSTILASTLHITRLNTRNQGVTNTDSNSGVGFRPGFDPSAPQNSAGVAEPPRRPENNQDTVANPVQIPGQADIRQAEGGPNPGSMNSFSSMLLWILGGASSEGLNSFFSMFRDVRDQGQVFAETPHDENRENQDNDR
ncbi:hypothetical protein Ahy_B10g101403 isoform C [Arachis hypogaea]|uniref:Membralin n=1 Tax=Arachis hypogaea TaxID=3818 RepID=A0A444WZG1_ARAHY|nr:hypothetical protein Ahy_B10g101403 isoform C [Arachis hypogaea]